MQFMTIFFIIMTKTCPISRKRILEITLGYDRGISGHPESKFDGNVGVLERKHVIVTDIRHIGKESDTLNEPFGLDEFRYEFQDDPERADEEFRENTDRIMNLEPKDVIEVGINRTTLWNVKEKIKKKENDKITDKIEIKILSALKKQLDCFDQIQSFEYNDPLKKINLCRDDDNEQYLSRFKYDLLVNPKNHHYIEFLKYFDYKLVVKVQINIKKSHHLILEQ